MPAVASARANNTADGQKDRQGCRLSRCPGSIYLLKISAWRLERKAERIMSPRLENGQSFLHHKPRPQGGVKASIKAWIDENTTFQMAEI